MKMNVINQNNDSIILLIHPMLSSAVGMKKIIVDNLKGNYNYLIPDLSGHGIAKDDNYNSASEEAKEIYNYLKSNNIQTISLAFGASLGGVVLFELLKYKDIEIRKVFIEGGSFYTNSNLLEWIYKKSFLLKHKKAIKNRELSIKKMTELYGKLAGEQMADTFINMSKASIINISHDCNHVNLPSLSEDEQKNFIFSYGSKDLNLKRAKKAIKRFYPNSKLIIWDKLSHCEKITKESSEFCNLLESEIPK